MTDDRPPIRVPVTLTWPLFRRYVIAVQLRWVFLLCFAVGLAPWLQILLGSGANAPAPATRALVQAGLWTFVAWLLIPVMTLVANWRLWNRTPEMREAKVYELGDSEIAWSSPSSRGDFKWDLVRGVTAKMGMIVIQLAANQAIVIPELGISSDDRRALNELFQRKVPNFRSLS